LTGKFRGSAIFGKEETNETVVNSEGEEDIFIAKYDLNGALLWVRTAGGYGIDSAYGITVLPNGDIKMTGSSSGGAIFGEDEPEEIALAGHGGGDIFIAEFSAGDDIPLVYGESPTTNTTPVWHWYEVKNATEYRVSFDESNWSTPSGLSYSDGLKAIGDHTLFVQAFIESSWSQSGSFTTTIETPAPDTILSESPADTTNLKEATFMFESSIAGATFECKLDTQPFESCSPPTSYSSLTTGQHTFMVKAFASGKEDPTPATFTWTITPTYTFSSKIVSGSSNPSDLFINNIGELFVADSANHRVQKFDNNGLLAFTIGEYGSTEGQFNSPKGVFFDELGGNIYVADTGNNRVQIFDNSGQFVNEIDGTEAAGPGQFNQPWAIGVRAGNEVYVVDQGNHKVHVYGSGMGFYSSSFGIEGVGTGEFKSPSGITFTNDFEKLLIADTGNNRIQIFNYYGEPLSSFGTTGSGAGEFLSPKDVTVDTKGNIYVADSDNRRVQVFDHTHNFIEEFGGEGVANGNFENPSGVAVSYSGEIFVADTGYNRLQKFFPGKSVQNSIGGSGTLNGQFNFPAGVAVDNSGTIFVADRDNNRVQLLSSKGKHKNSITGLSSPVDITFGFSGEFYVLEQGANQIRIYDSNLTQQTVFDGTANSQPLLNPSSVVFAGESILVSDTGNNLIQVFTAGGGGSHTFASQNPVALAMWDIEPFVIDGTDKVIRRYTHPSGTVHGSQPSFGSGILLDPKGITIDQDTRTVYVSDAGSESVKVFIYDAQQDSYFYHAEIGESGNGPSNLDSPLGIDLFGGKLYVSETSKNRVKILEKTAVFVAKIADGESNQPRDITVGVNGNIYVLNTDNNSVKIYTSDGTLDAEFGSPGTGQGEFQSPFGIALDSASNIYVADTMNNRIQIFNSTGEFLSQLGGEGGGDGELSLPRGIAVHKNGDIYVADTSNHRIQIFKPDYTFRRSFGVNGTDDGEFNQPYRVAFDAKGNIYVTDTFNNRVQKFDQSLRHIKTFGSSGSGNSQFQYPFAVAVDSEENVYVTDADNNRVQIFDKNGNFLAKFGKQGSEISDISAPTGIAIDKNGNLYVSDAGNNRLMKYRINGPFVKEITEGVNQPKDVFVDKNGYIYVADTLNHRILKLSPTGEYMNETGSEGAANGQFSSPSGIALFDNGDIVVVDSGNNRLQVFDSDLNFKFPVISVQGFLEFSSPTDVVFDETGSNFYVSNTGNSNILKFDSSAAFIEPALGTLGTNDGEFQGVTSLAIDKNGDILAVDTSNARVQKLDTDGNYIGQFNDSGNELYAFSTPKGIAVDSRGYIYVSEEGGNRIRVFDSMNNFLGLIDRSGNGPGELQSPSGLAIDSSDNLYVADQLNNRIQVFKKNFYGHKKTFYGDDSNFGRPSFIYSNFSGDIYVTDEKFGRISIFDSTGTFIETIGADGDFVAPSGIFEHEGNIKVADGAKDEIRIYETYMEPTWTLISAGTGTEPGQFDTPMGMAGGDCGCSCEFYVDSGNNRIQAASYGSWIESIGSTGQGDTNFNYPVDVAYRYVAGNDRVFVSDSGNNRVQIFNFNCTDFTYQGTIGEAGQAEGQFSSTGGVTFDNDGLLYVADRGNHRIQVFKFNESSENYDFLTTFGSEGYGDEEFTGPTSIFFNTLNQKLHIIDNNRVVIYEKQ